MTQALLQPIEKPQASRPAPVVPASPARQRSGDDRSFEATLRELTQERPAASAEQPGNGESPQADTDADSTRTDRVEATEPETRRDTDTDADASSDEQQETTASPPANAGARPEAREEPDGQVATDGNAGADTALPVQVQPGPSATSIAPAEAAPTDTPAARPEPVAPQAQPVEATAAAQPEPDAAPNQPVPDRPVEGEPTSRADTPPPAATTEPPPVVEPTTPAPHREVATTTAVPARSIEQPVEQQSASPQPVEHATAPAAAEPAPRREERRDRSEQRPLPSSVQSTVGGSAAPARAEQVEQAVRLEQQTGQPAVRVADGGAERGASMTRAAVEQSTLRQPEPEAETVTRRFTGSVVRGLSAMVNQRGGVLSMRLDPPELGQLRVQMSIHQGTVSAQFTAASQQTQLLLERNMATLRAALEGQGLTVERLSVQPAAQTSQTGGADAQHQGRGDHADDGASDEQAGSRGDHERGGHGDPSGRRQPRDFATYIAGDEPASGPGNPG